MEDVKAPSNVIQFPTGKKREAEDKVSSHPVNPPAPPKAPLSDKRGSKTKVKTAGAVLAIMFLTAAVNRYAFRPSESLDASSLSNTSRTIASVEQVGWLRDAAWEKQLAESLASPQARTIASTGIGHNASAEEKLRWGTLEEKYTIVYKADVHKIETIVLQDANANPAYILDRGKFLREYGLLLDESFARAELKSAELSPEKTVETYTIFDKDQRPKGEARFELDRHKRLLSLKVEPVQI